MRWSIVVLVLVGCTGKPVPAAVVAPTVAGSAEASGAGVPSSGATPPPAAAAPVAAPSFPTEQLAFDQVLEAPITSIAMGEKRGAVLSGGLEAHLYDGARWSSIPLPRVLVTGTSTLAIYMGRDDRPRVMGFRADGPDAPPSPVYLRYKEGWRSQLDEIGRLGAGGTGRLYGVLGWDDPEVVCRDGESCIIKRVTGWSTVDNPGYARVRLCGRDAWAWGDWGIARLVAQGFDRDVAPHPGERVETLWALDERTLLAIVDDVAQPLRRFAAGRWQPEASPLAHPRAIAGTEGDVWLVGDDGAARLSGGAWVRVGGVDGPLQAVLVSERGVWLGGPRGLFRFTARAEPATPTASPKASAPPAE